jgi:hypothetical protein
MSNTYVLVNPHVQGDFKNTITAKNSIEAGRALYKSLSEHFNNAVPKFYFTIQKGGSGKGKYYHFQVKEKLKKGDNVSFTFEPYEVVGGVDVESFSKKLNEFKNKFAQAEEKRNQKNLRNQKIHQNPILILMIIKELILMYQLLINQFIIGGMIQQFID